MLPRKIPQRLCCGCGQMKPKRELVRVARAADGTISFDTTGKSNGRGAYICANPEGLEKAKKGRRFERAFGCAVDESLFEELKDVFAKKQNN